MEAKNNSLGYVPKVVFHQLCFIGPLRDKSEGLWREMRFLDLNSHKDLREALGMTLGCIPKIVFHLFFFIGPLRDIFERPL